MEPPLQIPVDPAFEAEFGALLIQLHAATLSYDDIIAALQDLKTHELCDTRPVHRGLVENTLGVVEFRRGDIGKSRTYFEQADAIFERCGDDHRRAQSLNNIGETHRYRGSLQQAQHYFERALEISQRVNNLEVEGSVLNNQGQLYYQLGQYEKACELLLQAEALCQIPWENPESDHMMLSRMNCEAESHYTCVSLYLDLRNVGAAKEHADKGLRLAEKMKSALAIGFAQRAMGNVLTALYEQGQDSNPDDYYRAAADSFNEIKSEGELGKTLLAHGKSLVRRGRKQAAAQLFRRAMEIFTHAGMTNDAALAAEAQLSVI